MQDQLADILDYIKGVVRHKWVIIIFAWIISACGWVYVYKMPNQYKSEARVHVDTRTMLRPLLRGLAVQSDVTGLVAIMKKLMLTQQNMLKIAELAGVDGDFNSDKGRYKIVNDLKDHLQIGGGQEEIFSISYETTSAMMAQSVVQAVLSVFSEQTQQSTMGDVATAQRFIEDQIKEYEQRLRNAEKARENFKRVNIGLLPGQGENQLDKMQLVRQEIDKTEMAISEMASRRQALQAQLNEALESDEEWGLTDLTKKESSEEGRINSLEKMKQELLLKYTDNHPYVLSIESRLKDLEQEKAKKKALTSPEFPNATAMSSPYAQTIKLEINKIDAEVATLNARVAAFKTKLKQGDEEFNARLAIETEMQNLNRDYDTIKANYLKLIERREEADISEKMDNQVTALKFKIADPANRPVDPSSPNRKLLYSVILIAGCVIGLVVALLIVLIRPVFTSTRNIRTVTGLPVLGSVSVVVSEQKRRAQRYSNILFSVVSALLLGGYSAMMAMELFLK